MSDHDPPPLALCVSQSGCEGWEPRLCTPALHRTRSTRCCSGWPTQVGPAAGHPAVAVFATDAVSFCCLAVFAVGWGPAWLGASPSCGCCPVRLLALKPNKAAQPAGYGFGGMLTVELPNLERAKLLMERLQNKHGFGEHLACRQQCLSCRL